MQLVILTENSSSLASRILLLYLECTKLMQQKIFTSCCENMSKNYLIAASQALSILNEFKKIAGSVSRESKHNLYHVMLFLYSIAEKNIPQILTSN